MQLAGNEPEVASPVPTARGLPDRGVATLAGRWRGPGFGGKLDYPALLADALGVTVEELQTAQEAAHQAALEQALEEGLITQEQADRMLSLRAVRGYLNREALLAEALGMSVAELQAAYEEGATLSTLMADRGLDAAALREALNEAHNAALARAVADGVVTQEQADELQQDCGRGLMPGGEYLPEGRGRRHGRGGLRDRFNKPAESESDTDIGFRNGRFLRGNDSL
jgi:hypothetical protein